MATSDGQPQLKAPCDLRSEGAFEPSRDGGTYEYLDHPADIQIHAWGTTLSQAYEQSAIGMFGYMTDICKVTEESTEEVIAEGDDLISLLYHFLDEWLFIFSAEPFFIPRRIEILEFDDVNFKIICRGYGEIFDLSKHPQGTEVKAITYSNMQVISQTDKHEVYVIVDI